MSDKKNDNYSSNVNNVSLKEDEEKNSSKVQENSEKGDVIETNGKDGCCGGCH